MTRTRTLHRLRTLTAVAVLASSSIGFASTDDNDNTRLNQQRAAFERVWDDVVDGQWPLDKRTEKLLKDYALWPDLRAAYYSSHLQVVSNREVTQFIASAPDLPPVKRLRYRYTEHQLNNAQWRRFAQLYDQHYRNAGIAALDCAALSAATSGKLRWSGERRDALAKKLWLVATSQHDRCDTPFANLRNSNAIDALWVRQRMQLAIDAKRFSLAAYLARSLNGKDEALVSTWRQAHRDPAEFLRNANAGATDAMLAHATKRLAVRDTVQAHALWQQVLRQRDIAPEDRGEIARFIGIASAQDREPTAGQWLDDVPRVAADQRVLEWRARVALQAGDWNSVLRAIARMDMDIAAQDRWRYWEAMALLRSEQQEAGGALLAALANERSYHGFLAADALDIEYRFSHAPLPADETLIGTLAARRDIIRVRELYAVGQTARARAELSIVRASLTDEGLTALAALTHRWSWHPEAIALLGQLRFYDDLSIRFPLAFDELIRDAAQRDQLRDTWVRGIARTESLFQVDAKSAAGAHGLMQLLPSTAKQQARRSGLPWRGTQSLREAETNISLGSAHLASLLARFDHPALATAAYNAGAHRVERWTSNIDTMPADIWIESIAYDETRRYVERVMFAEVVFAWRQGKPVTRLKRRLKPVKANQSPVARAPALYSGALETDSNT